MATRLLSLLAALLLSLNRKTHKAYYRTREGNFNINGFEVVLFCFANRDTLFDHSIFSVIPNIFSGCFFWV